MQVGRPHAALDLIGAASRIFFSFFVAYTLKDKLFFLRRNSNILGMYSIMALMSLFADFEKSGSSQNTKQYLILCSPNVFRLFYWPWIRLVWTALVWTNSHDPLLGFPWYCNSVFVTKWVLSVRQFSLRFDWYNDTLIKIGNYRSVLSSKIFKQVNLSSQFEVK